MGRRCNWTFFFENAAGAAVTVTGDRYRDMIANFLWAELDGMDVDNFWFQQDGATSHTANQTIELLRTRFPGRVISRHGDQNWPPRSCDITPMDFFVWGFLKGKVYANNPQTLQELKYAIRNAFAEMVPQLCARVIQNFVNRMDICQRSRGGHLSDIVFHV